uniref:GLOBIN domain-containing protein n=1 Tax=Caenorhabditis tropicalis TaxID=1561998 RepID=A0A1I7US15_9PELO
MGQENSKCPHQSLAEKRYKVERPKTKKVSSGSATDRSPPTQTDEKSAPLRLTVSSCDVNSDDVEDLPEIRKLSVSEPNEEEATSMANSAGVAKSKCKHFLTRRERILLEQSWRKTRKTGADHIGSKIFFMVLTAQPDIKAIFGLEKIPTGRLKYDPRFRQHALVYTKTLDFVIRNLDYPGKLEVYFENLGKRHVAMQGRGFEPGYWETFAECMTQAAVEWEANRQRPTLGAWRNLISCIISFMRRGFDEETGKRSCTATMAKDLARIELAAPFHHTPPVFTNFFVFHIIFLLL